MKTDESHLSLLTLSLLQTLKGSSGQPAVSLSQIPGEGSLNGFGSGYLSLEPSSSFLTR